MTNAIKSEGYTVDIVLPAKTCSAKLLKQLTKLLPTGTQVNIAPTGKSLNGET